MAPDEKKLTCSPKNYLHNLHLQGQQRSGNVNLSLGRCTELKLLLRMYENGRTLPDMLATVPELLAECASIWGESCLKKALRLVNKELSVTTMRVVWRASVQLGEGAYPPPRQVARIMQPARLDSMTVTIATTSGGRSDQASARSDTQ